MDDSKEILFIALSNSLLVLNSSLEENPAEEDRATLEYLINRHEELILELESEILADEPEDIEDQVIPKPKWP